MLLRIAIVEDEPTYQTALKKQILNWECKNQNRVHIMTYSSGAAFLMVWPDQIQFDGIFLDIRLPGEDGLEIARLIRQHSEDLPIVFVTGVMEKVFQGYDVNALHYLIKPPEDRAVEQCLDKILLQTKRKESDCYLIRFEGGWVRVPYSEIVYLESLSHYIQINTLDNTYLIRKNLTELVDELPGQFIRCYRSFIVNIQHVIMIRPKEILLTNKKTVPLSSTYATEINRQFIKYHDL